MINGYIFCDSESTLCKSPNKQESTRRVRLNVSTLLTTKCKKINKILVWYL